ncbi:MAG: T9SS type A sorting domain-containing protein [bacterium]|nr:T9SS type A sorting domain-containing protein [Candidatus Kapabacteria bacterium]
MMKRASALLTSIMLLVNAQAFAQQPLVPEEGDIFYRFHLMVDGARYNAAGTLIAVAHKEGVEIIDAYWKKPVELLVNPFPTVGGLFRPEFDRSGTRVLASSTRSVVVVWTLEPYIDYSIARDNAYHYVTGAHFSPDGRHVVTTSYDSTVKIINIHENQIVMTFRGHGDKTGSARYSGDGLRIVSVGADDTLRIWNASTGIPERSIELNGISSGASFSPDGVSVMAPAGNTITEWNASTGEVRHRFIGHTDHILHAEYDTSGQYIVSTGFDSSIRVWSTATGQLLNTIDVDRWHQINSVTFAPDAKTVLTTGLDSTIRIFQLNLPSSVSSRSSHVRYEATIVPNPVSQSAYIELPTIAIGLARVSISDGLGRVVVDQSAEVSTTDNRIPLNVDELVDGMYSVVIILDRQTFRRRFIVQK